MSIDTTRIAEQVNAFWSAHGYAVIIGTGLVALALVATGLVKAVRSPQRDRWVSGVAAVVVLAWTSEGLWEVGRYTLGLPVAFAVMTFFVFEAMMLSSALQAEQHRRRHGTPGPAGRYVWVLATCTAVIVAVSAATVVESLLRFVLPLAAAGLWWVGITTARDEDAEEVRQAREQEAARRAATWAVTPRTVLVGLGVMRPGAVDVTDAERERRVRRMVVAADRLHTARPGERRARRAVVRLRRLARLATAEDVGEVRARVERTTGIIALVTPTNHPGSRSAGTSAALWQYPSTAHHLSPLSTTPPADGDANPEPRLSPRAQSVVANRPDDARRSQATARRQPTAERVAKAVAKHPDASKVEVASRLGVSERTVQRYWPSDNGHQHQEPSGQRPVADHHELPTPKGNSTTSTHHSSSPAPSND